MPQAEGKTSVNPSLWRHWCGWISYSAVVKETKARGVDETKERDPHIGPSHSVRSSHLVRPTPRRIFFFHGVQDGMAQEMESSYWL
jgi:hypothetical protein